MKITNLEENMLEA